MAGVLKIAVVPAVPIRSNAFSEEYDGHSMNENVSNARQHEVRCIMCVVTEYFNVLDWEKPKPERKDKIVKEQD